MTSSPPRKRDFDRITGPATLDRYAREYLDGTRIVIASNREPYQHVHREGGIEVIRSPGGLASALDSVARATGGTWVAQAAGDADRETVDAAGRVKMPPKLERYTLQRLWIEPEERAVQFNRFANGCLWPLCHVVYVRPQFVTEQWEAYREVNRIFADAILRSAGRGPALVLLQDYHLALCAAMLRARRPDLSIVLFWHIPWPNHDVFRILPWKVQVLEGLLACDLVGFHIAHHAMNFLDTVAGELEANIDRERIAVRRHGHRTMVRHYPISPDVEEISLVAEEPETREAARRIRESVGMDEGKIILGVDRLDYTKGVPERLYAYERFLEIHPKERGRVALIQVGVPTRVDLPEYQSLMATVESRAAEINDRFGTPEWRPIHLITSSLGFRELIPYYVAADVMAVTSLHDGMNLVAKEYVAAKPTLEGALVLSPYTGASRELEFALQASPYDREALTAAIHRALHLSTAERTDRMRALREIVGAANIYDWALRLIRDVKRLHLLPGARPATRR